MQKKVIALAVAALASGAAMAQSNVTVYGIADVAGTIFNTTNKAATQLQNQRGFDDGAVGSRIGFKGEEGLGNGLKAEFLYELGIAPTNNVNQVQSTANGNQLNNLSTRTAWVGLTSSSLGQVAMGRFHTLGWEFMANARPWGGIDPFRTMGNSVGITAHTSDRISNAFQYTTPTFLGGLSGRVQYSADSQGGGNADTRTNDQAYVGTTLGRQGVALAGVRYNQGPIDTQVIYKKIYQQTNAASEIASVTPGRKEWGVRGAYDFGVVKLGAAYQHVTMSDQLPVGYKEGYYYAGYATVPVGSSFLLSFEAAKAKGDLGAGGTGYMVNGQYLFSKRTSIYAQAGHMKINDSTAYVATTGLGSTVNLGSYGATGIASGQAVNAFMAGILHSF